MLFSEDRLQRLECVISTAREPELRGLPVNDVPNILHVRRLSVKVLLPSLISLPESQVHTLIGGDEPVGSTRAPTCRHQRWAHPS